MKKIWILVLGTLTCFYAKAQSESFPLYYSQYGMNGTAAYVGKAGAIGALGGDVMSAQYNPAGLGMYRSSEITFSLGLDITNSNAKYNGLKADDSYPAFNFGNLGMVLDFNNGKKSSFRHVQLSFGINRLMNFNNRNKIIRNNVASSYINDNVMNQIVNNNDLNSDFITTGVVDTAWDSQGCSISSIFESGDGFNQLKTIKESGYLNEFSMSLSTNYENWLYLGATIGIPFGDYTHKTYFSEERFVGGVSTGYYNYNTEQRLSATGINLKLGAIVRPIDWLRLGVAIHTPTWYSVNDDYFSGVSYYNSRADGWWPTFEYNMQSPWRFLASGAIVLGNNKSKLSGTISVDYEYADYSHMQFNDMDDIILETDLNNNIEEQFGGANTLRIGGELKYGNLRARVGYAYFGNPYSSDDYNVADWNYITCGVGYKGKIFSFDLSYAYGHTKDGKYYMYNIYDQTNNYWYSDPNPTKTESTKHLVQATFGIRF